MSYFVFFCVSFNVLITSVGEERAIFSAIVLFGVVSSSSWCLDQVVLFYCCFPWSFHILI